MPSVSKNQQQFMGLVHALQKGEIDPEDVSQEVRDAAKSMSKKDAKDFASTKHKGLPTKVKKEIYKRLKQEYARMDNRHSSGDDEADENFPANWLTGRTGDHHSLARSKKRKADNKRTNFVTKNSGQEDLEDENINEVLIMKPHTIVGLLPKSAFKTGGDGKQLITNLVDTLNKFYKDNNVNIRIR